MRAALCLALAGCAGTLPAQGHLTQSSRGRLVADGVAVSGHTCGDEYQDAVAGVARAEREMADCARLDSLGWDFVLGAFGVVGATALASTRFGPRDRDDEAYVGLGIAAALFATGALLKLVSRRHLARAVRIYDASPHW